MFMSNLFMFFFDEGVFIFVFDFWLAVLDFLDFCDSVSGSRVWSVFTGSSGKNFGVGTRTA